MCVRARALGHVLVRAHVHETPPASPRPPGSGGRCRFRGGRPESRQLACPGAVRSDRWCPRQRPTRRTASSQEGLLVRSVSQRTPLGARKLEGRPEAGHLVQLVQEVDLVVLQGLGRGEVQLVVLLPELVLLVVLRSLQLEDKNKPGVSSCRRLSRLSFDLLPQRHPAVIAFRFFFRFVLDPLHAFLWWQIIFVGFFLRLGHQ